MNIINTPIGWLSIEEENAKLVDIEFMNRKTSRKQNHTVLEKKHSSSSANISREKTKNLIYQLTYLALPFKCVSGKHYRKFLMAR